MDSWDGGLLRGDQATFVARKLPGVTLRGDLSWGLIDTRVLHVNAGGRDLIVKAGGPGNHHIGREITGRELVAGGPLGQEKVGMLLAADRDLRVLVVEYLPGVLVEGTDAELDPEVHRQAGALLAAIHATPLLPGMTAPDPDVLTAKALAYLDSDHRIGPGTVAEVRRILKGLAAASGAAAPDPVQDTTAGVLTHGDWQPRNWLIDDGVVRVIDFGRCEVRSAESDLGRLAVQQWRGRPDLEDAFLDGYGSDPRDPRTWPLNQLREAVGTAVWAYGVGDEAFEQQGHRMLAEALELF